MQFTASRRTTHVLKLNIFDTTSESFIYTGEFGYKLEVVVGFRIHQNGSSVDNKEVWISIYTFVVQGEYDALLKWPADFSVRFVLFDQNNNEVQ